VEEEDDEGRSVGRLDDVTKLLQTQRRDSQWLMYAVFFVNVGAFPFFLMSPQGRRSAGITSGKIPLEILKSVTL